MGERGYVLWLLGVIFMATSYYVYCRTVLDFMLTILKDFHPLSTSSDRGTDRCSFIPALIECINYKQIRFLPCPLLGSSM